MGLNLSRKPGQQITLIIPPTAETIEVVITQGKIQKQQTEDEKYKGGRSNIFIEAPAEVQIRRPDAHFPQELKT